MKITSLESQKRDSSRLNMYIDENFFCGISLNVVAQFGIYQGKELSDTELNEILTSELRSRFFDRAVSYLVRSPKTEFQVRRYLKDLVFKKKGKWFEDVSKEDISSIEEFVVKKPTSVFWDMALRIFGFAAVVIGLSLVIGMLTAMLSHS